MLRLVWAAISAIIFRGPLRCLDSERTKMGFNQSKVVSALKGNHKRIEYRARLARNQTLEALDTGNYYAALFWQGKARLRAIANYRVCLWQSTTSTSTNRNRQGYNFELQLLF